jgi:hypothetical protein
LGPRHHLQKLTAFSLAEFDPRPNSRDLEGVPHNPRSRLPDPILCLCAQKRPTDRFAVLGACSGAVGWLLWSNDHYSHIMRTSGQYINKM